MKSFKEYLKQIAEDKVIAKEDEGAAAPAGDVSAPSGDSAPSGEVISTHQKTDGGLTTTDVLGKCDHKHDGFFGPGCFHRPFPIFSYPVSRIKRKKRKYIKVLDLTESEEYEIFHPLANSIIEQEMDDANKYLQKTGIQVFYEDDYDFSGKKKDWVGATDFERQEDANNFGIAINLPVLYGFLEENSLENDETEIKCQIKATIYHEIGHCLVQKFRDDETYDFEMTENEEEKLVEEFANYMLREYTGVNSSKLNDFVNEIFRENLEEEQIDETDSIVSPDFLEKPINFLDPRRKILPNAVKLDKFGDPVKGCIDIPVKASENIFEGEPVDYKATLLKNGFVRLVPQSSEPDEDVEMFNALPGDQKETSLGILQNPDSPMYDRMEENGELNQKLSDLRAEAIMMDDEERNALLQKLKSAQTGQIEGAVYFKPTVPDIIRIFNGKVETLPLKTLVIVDDRENHIDKELRYSNEAQERYAVKTDRIRDGNDERFRICQAVLKNMRHFGPDRTSEI